MVVLETAGLNTTELGSYCRERGLYPEQVDRWCKAAQDANAQPLLPMAEQKDLEKRHQADQRELKRLQQELRRKDKALAEAAALLIASKKLQPYWGEDEGGLTTEQISAKPWRFRGCGGSRCKGCCSRSSIGGRAHHAAALAPPVRW